MLNDEITFAEEEFIKMYKNFAFLLKYGFKGSEFRIGSREPGLTFENNITKISIIIYWSEAGYLDVQIIKKKRCSDKGFSIRKYYKYFNTRYMFELVGTDNILKANALFLHDNFLPILKGEIWIDELLKRNGIKNDFNK